MKNFLSEPDSMACFTLISLLRLCGFSAVKARRCSAPVESGERGRRRRVEGGDGVEVSQVLRAFPPPLPWG